MSFIVSPSPCRYHCYSHSHSHQDQRACHEWTHEWPRHAFCEKSPHGGTVDELPLKEGDGELYWWISDRQCPWRALHTSHYKWNEIHIETEAMRFYRVRHCLGMCVGWECSFLFFGLYRKRSRQQMWSFYFLGICRDVVLGKVGKHLIHAAKDKCPGAHQNEPRHSASTLVINSFLAFIIFFKD